MINEIIPGTQAASNIINNSGGPRSRTRSETVNESYLNSSNSFENGFYAIDLPGDIHDIETWLLDLAKQIGWYGWKDINSRFNLPDEKLMVIIENDTDRPSYPPEKANIIRTAIILSMCNKNCYMPYSPRIFTRSRLDRKIKLIKIKINNFYELE